MVLLLIFNDQVNFGNLESNRDQDNSFECWPLSTGRLIRPDLAHCVQAYYKDPLEVLLKRLVPSSATLCLRELLARSSSPGSINP